MSKTKTICAQGAIYGRTALAGGVTTKDDVAFGHPAMFPEKLALDHIMSWSNEGDLVLDPFAGAGTVLKMAALNGRNFLGFEISGDYCAIARERLAQYGIMC